MLRPATPPLPQGIERPSRGSNPGSFINLWDPLQTIYYQLNKTPIDKDALDALNRYCLLVMFYLTKRMLYLSQYNIPEDDRQGHITLGNFSRIEAKTVEREQNDNTLKYSSEKPVWIWYHHRFSRDGIAQQTQEATTLKTKFANIYGDRMLFPVVNYHAGNTPKAFDSIHSSVPIFDRPRDIISRPSSSQGSVRPKTARDEVPSTPQNVDNVASSLTEVLWVLLLGRLGPNMETPVNMKVYKEPSNDPGIYMISPETASILKEYGNLDISTTKSLLLYYCEVYTQFIKQRYHP